MSFSLSHENLFRNRDFFSSGKFTFLQYMRLDESRTGYQKFRKVRKVLIWGISWGLFRWQCSAAKNLPANAGHMGCGVRFWVGNGPPWRRTWRTTPVFLPEKKNKFSWRRFSWKLGFYIHQNSLQGKWRIPEGVCPSLRPVLKLAGLRTQVKLLNFHCSPSSLCCLSDLLKFSSWSGYHIPEVMKEVKRTVLSS